MMIKEVTYYDIICDRCGKSLTQESGYYYPDANTAAFDASVSEWLIINCKHYCPDCYDVDEETDEYVPKKEGKQSKTICCGECEVFLYEDINGYGICGKTNEECYCGDKCHINHGKP